MNKNILILGSGGREHALAWKINQSPLLGKLHSAPGNPGIAAIATTVTIGVNDFESLGEYCIAHQISIVIVGPEDPLVNGISNYFKDKEELKHIFVFGPNQIAAQLEGSKDFSKRFMQKHNIPTAKYETFTKGQENEACTFLETMKAPYVLKADGLAAGKGVLIVENLEAAQSGVKEMLSGKFGTASEKLVIEEFLEGMEVSYFALCDGESYTLLPEAKDYKRIGEGDTGLNTGGMGAVSPVPFANTEFTEKVKTQVVEPTIEGLKKDGIEYVGFLFFGLIKVGENPMVIEYNCRMGDPETEVVLPRLKSDLLEAIILASEKNISSYQVEFAKEAASTVIAVSGGYPESYEKGMQITIPESLSINQILFQAGTKMHDDLLTTSGGRVMACTGLGENLETALQNSYQMMDGIKFNKKNFRTDIGKDILK